MIGGDIKSKQAESRGSNCTAKKIFICTSLAMIVQNFQLLWSVMAGKGSVKLGCAFITLQLNQYVRKLKPTFILALKMSIWNSPEIV